MTILVLTDKLGITDGYRWHWESLVMNAGMYPSRFTEDSVWRSGLQLRIKLLTQRGNRKSPGFNEEAFPMIQTWFNARIDQLQPAAALIQDIALLQLVEPKWENAILDNLRGGVYKLEGPWGYPLPVLISLPISAINSKKTPKDIGALNAGAKNKDEFEERKRLMESGEEDDEESLEKYVGSDEIFLEPYVIPYGRFILFKDLQKLNRVITAANAGEWP